MTGAKRLAVLWAVAGVVAMCAPAGAQEVPSETMLVTYASETRLDRAVAEGGSLEQADDDATEIAGRVAVAELTPAESAAVAATPGVLAVEPDLPVFAAEVVNDPCYTTPSSCGRLGAWHLDRVGLPAAWDLSHGGATTVAVLDSGMSPVVPDDLAGRVLPEVNATFGGLPCTSGSALNHGTQVAGTIGAIAGNELGTAGTGFDVRILPVRVWAGPNCVNTSLSYVVNGITMARNSGARIINVSLTTNGDVVALRTAVEDATNAGVVVVAAAGNGGSVDPTIGEGGYPAFYPSTLSVGATCPSTFVPGDCTGQPDARATFSNFGGWVDLFAPGVLIPTYNRNGSPAFVDGTSFSAPVVAGIVALIRSVRPNLTPAQVSDILVRSADPVHGLRRLDARGALYDTVFGAVPANGVGVHATSSTSIEVMSRANDGRAMVRTLPTGAPGSRWSLQTDGVLLGNPDLTSMVPGRLDAVGRGTDGTVFYRARTGGWSPWVSVGGTATSDVAIVSWGPNRLDFFARGGDNALWHSAWTGSMFTGWESLGGVLSSEPDATTWGPGRLDVFARGTDGGIYHLAFDRGRWQPWEALGGLATTGPGAVAWGPDRVDIVAAGGDGQLWHKAWVGTGWSAWVPRGGLLASGPEIVSRTPGTLDIFVRAADHQVWQLAFNGSTFSGWLPVT